MILIIAEKPSLGRNIAAALGAGTKGEGCLSGGNYIVTWAFGHLFSLADIEAYQTEPPKKKGWTLEGLPCFPETFRFQLRPGTTKRGTRSKRGADPGVRKQFEIISGLCRRADVDCIVNAGDADREGEIIVRLILAKALPEHHTKKLCRLWLPDQTAQTIRAATKALEPESDYDRLANEGYARTYVDWLYGVNLTRYATVRTGKLLRVGRVIVPIVKAIYDRDMEIRNFVPRPYYAVRSGEKTKGEVLDLVSKKEFERNEAGRQAAEALCARYNAGTAKVVSVARKRVTLPPGKLFSLSKLQSLLGRKYKMPMSKSLEVLQKLYEEGYVTYPRTNSEYLAEAEKDKIAGILGQVREMGYAVTMKDTPSIFNDKKIESHSALTPTSKIPAKEKLSPEEARVYSTIFRRFAAVFCEKDCIAEKTEMVIGVFEGEELLESFTLRGTVILEQGWMKYDDAPQKKKVLPALEKGENVRILFQPEEKETEPPRHYTIETLNNYLKNPFKEEKAKQNHAGGGADTEEEPADDTEEYRAVFEGLELGTEATRTGIIDNARNSGYIQLKKDVYTILPDGEFFIESLEKMQIVMDKFKTAELGRALKRVFRGEETVEGCVHLAEEKITEVFSKYGETSVERIPYQGKGTRRKTASSGKKEPVLKIGTCPLCGADVVRGQFAYGCMGYKNGCTFRVGREICGRAITPEEVFALTETGSTPLLDGFVSKNGKPFSAYLRLENGKVGFAFAQRGETAEDAEHAPPPMEPPAES